MLGMPSIKKYRGAWRYVLELEPGPDGKRRQIQKSGFRTKVEAVAALEKAQSLAVHGVRLDQTLTYGQWLDLWLAAKLNIKDRTRKGYQDHSRLYLKPALGHLELTKLRAEHLDAMYAALRERHKRPSPATIARVHATVRASLNAALVRRHIAFNPALQVELERVERRRMPVWTIPELKTFLALPTDDPWHPALCMIALTGLRRGEALRLTWDDIDLASARLYVRTAKTDAGVRTITLASDTVRRLRSLRKAQLTDRLEMGEAYNEGNRVLCWPDGSVPDPEILNRHFHKLAKQAGLPRIRLHDLRHTHASHALAAGEAMKVVSERLGHSTTQITADLYTKVLDEVAVDAAKRIGALYE
jgi:integrase